MGSQPPTNRAPDARNHDSGTLIVRQLLVFAIAVLLGAQVIRNAAVRAYSDLLPEKAARLWRNHPAVELSIGLARIGQDSRERKPVAPATFAMIDRGALGAPLSPTPFLVHGVRAQLAGDSVTAQLNFLAAQWRDPRSMPAAYFLADYYLRTGKPLEGLRQTALVARLSPNGVSSVAPFVARYAQERANWPQIRALFRSNPAIEEDVLEALASDPGNADALLALADTGHRTPSSQWLRRLLQSLVENREYGRAHAIWSSLAGGGPGNLIYDPGFSKSEAPPPFNWMLASSTVGLAERQPGNRLHLIFYGQQDGVLASQLLLLAPGTYRLRMGPASDATHAELLGWSVRCDKSSLRLSTASLDSAARGWTFVIPANCPAQWLELSGSSGDVAQQADVAIGAIDVARENPGA
jgi:hypothetical protein